MIKGGYNIPADERKLLKKVFWRTLTLSSTYNYERMQALGYVYTMIPVVDKYYTDEEAKREAYLRHFEIFNTTPTMAGFITGLSASMEKEASQDPNFNTASINAIKVSLMGPFAGIGDSIFWGSLRVITLGIGISMCAQGNPLGLLVHLLLFNIPATLVRWYGVQIGFGLGSSFLKQASESGLLGQITKAATIVGLMTVGAMTCTMVRFNIGLVLNIQGAELGVQGILDSIFPKLLPLLLVFACYKAISKGVKPVVIMLAMLVLGVAGKYLGIF
jgi:Phosphotransferase system, mannose/fructose/N-acetylgalactosamine-specific component IID